MKDCWIFFRLFSFTEDSKASPERRSSVNIENLDNKKSFKSGYVTGNQILF